MPTNTQSKPEKRDFKQEFLEMINSKYGTHNAIVMEDALKSQKKQVDQAMLEGGAKLEDIAKVKGIDLLSGLLKNNDSEKSAPQPMQQEGENQSNGFPRGWAGLGPTLMMTGAGLQGKDPTEILKNLISSQQTQNMNLSPEQVASKVKQANQALEEQGLEGYQAGITGGGDITASRSAAYGGMTSPKEIQSIAEGIVSGITPPDLKSVSSFRDRSKISAALSKTGYDLNTAEKDWKAANKFYAGMNSTQQIRLRQAINSVQGSLGNLETLNDEYKRLGFTPANKAQLVANSKGVGKQAVLATEYLTSLGVIQDELSQVFMGGNSPTEKFLEQAQKIVKSDYTFEQLQGVIKQLKLNLKYRLNSIDQAEPYTSTHKVAEEGENASQSIQQGWNKNKESRYQELLKKRG